MHCYECNDIESSEVIGLCHHCSAALCRKHATTVSEVVRTTEPLVRVVALPILARVVLCRTCKAALEQNGATLASAIV